MGGSAPAESDVPQIPLDMIDRAKVQFTVEGVTGLSKMIRSRTRPGTAEAPCLLPVSSLLFAFAEII
jgi:hypothetical protein